MGCTYLSRVMALPKTVSVDGLVRVTAILQPGDLLRVPAAPRPGDPAGRLSNRRERSPGAGDLARGRDRTGLPANPSRQRPARAERAEPCRDRLVGDRRGNRWDGAEFVSSECSRRTCVGYADCV